MPPNCCRPVFLAFWRRLLYNINIENTYGGIVHEPTDRTHILILMQLKMALMKALLLVKSVLLLKILKP